MEHIAALPKVDIYYKQIATIQQKVFFRPVLNLDYLALNYYEKKVPQHCSDLVKHQKESFLDALQKAGHFQYQQTVAQIENNISVTKVQGTD